MQVVAGCWSAGTQTALFEVLMRDRAVEGVLSRIASGRRREGNALTRNVLP